MKQNDNDKPSNSHNQDTWRGKLDTSHLKLILESLCQQPKAIQILIWICLSRPLWLLDAIFLRFSNINWDTGLIHCKRVKTGESVDFFALPPLLTLLHERSARLGPSAVYVFPELIFDEAELLDPLCNRSDWVVVPISVAQRAVMNGSAQIKSYFRKIGIKDRCITYKSLRRHMVLVLVSLGVLGELPAAIGSGAQLPHEAEILSAKELTWLYLRLIWDIKTTAPESLKLYHTGNSNIIHVRFKGAGGTWHALSTGCTNMAEARKVAREKISELCNPFDV